LQYTNSFGEDEGEKPRCPSCFMNFTVDLTQPPLELEDTSSNTGINANYAKSSIVNRINMDKWRSSTKIEALVEELFKLRREDKTIKRY
jgi:DNA repair protein RAD16